MLQASVRGRSFVGRVLGGGVALASMNWVAPRIAYSNPTIVANTPLVLERVTVVDVVKGQLLSEQRVVITGNRISAVGSFRAVLLPSSARIVQASGKYLIPGLWDLHVHPMHQAPVIYRHLLANGVTGIRDASSDVPLDTLILWRREVLAGTRVGPPRQLLSGQAIDGPDPACARVAENYHACVADSTDARHLVDSLVTAGADMIKMYSLSKPIYLTIAREARRVGIPFGGHITATDLSASEASDSGARLLDHIYAAGGLYAVCWDQNTRNLERCRDVSDRLRHNGTWVVPTIVAAMQYNFAGGGGERSLRVFERLRHRGSELTGDTLYSNWLRDSSAAASYSMSDTTGSMVLMQRAEVPIVAGTDDGVVSTMAPGFSLHAELAMYVAEGMTPLSALQSATLNPAEMLRATDSLGTVAADKLADLVLLDANPLSDITNTTTIRAVVANGRYFDRAELDGLLSGTAQRTDTP